MEVQTQAFQYEDVGHIMCECRCSVYTRWASALTRTRLVLSPPRSGSTGRNLGYYPLKLSRRCFPRSSYVDLPSASIPIFQYLYQCN